MCLCVPESQRRKSVPAQWLNESGRVAHPNSPAGQGGPGAFRSANVFSAYAGDELLPHPDAPAAREVDDSLIALAEGEEKAKAVRQPAPKVTDDLPDEVMQSVITLKIKKDATGGKMKGALTNAARTSRGQIFKNADTEKKVTSFTNTLAWTIVVRTTYGTGKPDDDAAYGRGTGDDEDTGNVTLGFHESCHRAHLANYFRSTLLPVFDGAVGDTVVDFEAKVDAHYKALDAYFLAAETTNVAAVDEVGDPTMTAYFAEPAPP